MPFIARSSIERVKDAIDMVELVSAYTDLRQQGGNYIGLCPFHEERTPSFSVDPVGKVYYCFGCEAGGDAFRLIEELESLDFNQSVEWLADRLGIEVEYEQTGSHDHKREDKKKRLLSLLDQVAGFYERYLWQADEAQRAREYLVGRGLGEETLRKFRVGYAPSTWDRVLKDASSKGFTVNELADAGLIVKGKTGGYYDRFRARIMFPLADSRGRTLGFGGRSVRDTQKPKYMNSPEGMVYHKGSALFGIDHARASAVKTREVIVVEGYTDVLALSQAGFTNTVAVMGTAVTPRQIKELAAIANTVFFAMDADVAGQEAMVRALQGAISRNLELKVIKLPDDNDPCDLLQAGESNEFERRLREAKSFLEFQVENILEKSDLSTAAGRDQTASALTPVFASVPDSALRSEQMRNAASRLRLSEDLVATVWGHRGKATGGQVPQSAIKLSAREGAIEKAYLAMCLAQGETGQKYLSKVDSNHFSSDLLVRAKDVLIKGSGDVVEAVDTGDRELSTLVSELMVRSKVEPSSKAKLEAGFQMLELRKLDRDIEQAKQSEDFKRMSELAQEKQQVKKTVDSATGAAL